jgi:rhamnosyltransferase
MSKVLVVIRTKNEERWIGHTLRRVFDQDMDDFDVVIVDNESTDHTVSIARRFPVADVINVTEYFPGRALNDGVRSQDSEFIACLSAHCVPQDRSWLRGLVSAFDDPSVAGVYGRQLPVAFSEPSDKRDLFNVFGLDRRIQKKDTFFHNANSMIRRSVWSEFPFDEAATNIEDRLWARDVIGQGFTLVYEPDAAVYHYHGIHQNNERERMRGVVSILEEFHGPASNELPESLLPENAKVAAVVPILGGEVEIAGVGLIERLVDELKTARFVDDIYVLCEDQGVADLASGLDVQVIERPEWLEGRDKGLQDSLQFALQEIEGRHLYPDVVVYANHRTPFRPKGLFDGLIADLQFKGLDSVFAAYRTWENYWDILEHGEAKPIGDHLGPLMSRRPLYRALYGLGCATVVSALRNGAMLGGRVGVLPVDDYAYTIKCSTDADRDLVELLLRQWDPSKRTFLSDSDDTLASFASQY